MIAPIVLIAGLVGAIIYLAFKAGYHCGYHQGFSDAARRTLAFSRWKKDETRAAYGKN
jgi:predicted Na+-dependent transporter